MTWAEYVFIAVCSLVVLAMIGTVNFAAGVLGAAFVGLAMWSLLTTLAGPEKRR